MTTLVTGVTGLVGNNLVRELLHHQRTVRVFVRPQSDPRPLEGLDVEVAQGDIRDQASVQEACQGIDVVVHAAGWVHVGWRGEALAHAVNVDGTRHVAEAARAVEARLIYVSSMNAMGVGRRDQPSHEESPRDGQVPCPYMITKRLAEEAVCHAVGRGLDAVIVNPGFMLGPWDWKPSSGRMVLEVARHFTPFAPRGGFSVCDVRDVTQGILQAIERGVKGRRYLLTGENMPYIELWRMIADVTGSGRPWCRTGPIAARAAGWAGDLVSYFCRNELDLNSAGLRISSQYHYYSCARAQSELGYRYRPPLESVRDSWKWFRKYGYV